MSFTKKKYNTHYLPSLFLLISILFVSFGTMIIENNLSIIIITLLGLSIGLGFTTLLINKKNLFTSIYIFLLFFLIYFIHTIIITYGLIVFYDTVHIKIDESYFYKSSIDVAYKLNQGYTIVDIFNIQRYGDVPAAVYMNGQIARVADIFGRNSIMVQKIFVLMFSAFIPMVMYNISRLYLTEKESIISAFIYGFFSFVPYLSSMILRDVHVAFTFIIVIFITLQKLSIKNLIILLAVSTLSYFLREQTGVFLLGFTSVYIFALIHNLLRNFYMELFLYMIILGIIIIIIVNSSLMDMFNTILNSSGERQVAQAASGSMGAKLAKLPYGLNIIGLFGYGQIQPFPFTYIFTKSTYKGFFQITYIMAGIAWLLGWGFLLYGVFKRKILTRIDLKLQLILLFSMAYLLLIAVVEFGVRRQMPVYPVLYMIMVFSYLELDNNKRNKIWITMASLYLTITIIFYFLKF